MVGGWQSGTYDLDFGRWRMDKRNEGASMDRREFIRRSAAAAVTGSAVLAATAETVESAEADELIRRNVRESMRYRQLGRTRWMSSTLVFGCGAALAGGKAVRLLDRAFEAGINFYDVGSDIYYKGSERAMAPFMKAHRDDIWVASKAPLRIRVKEGETFTVEQAKEAAGGWIRLMDASLKDLGTEYVDAYYLMGVDDPAVVRNEEVYAAFSKAKTAGKVGHFGLSTHKNAHKVLEAAIETGWYDLAMIGITPAGWYDWDEKRVVEGSPVLTELQPMLARARDAGIGLVGMKAVRQLSPMTSAGQGDPTAFDYVYDEKFKALPVNPFQRAYAHVLAHGLDVVNSDMQNFKHLEENIAAAAMRLPV